MYFSEYIKDNNYTCPQTTQFVSYKVKTIQDTTQHSTGQLVHGQLSYSKHTVSYISRVVCNCGALWTDARERLWYCLWKGENISALGVYMWKVGAVCYQVGIQLPSSRVHHSNQNILFLFSFYIFFLFFFFPQPKIPAPSGQVDGV